MTECCPTCGRPNPGPQTRFREQLIKYADGTRSAAELAELTGSTPGSVHVALHALRQLGIPVKAAGKPGGNRRKIMPRKQYEHVHMLAQQGLPWDAIGRLLQRDGISLYNAYHHAQKTYGLPAGSFVKKKEITPATMSAYAN